MFWAPCGSGEGTGGWVVSGGIWEHEGVPRCTHMHAYTCTHTHAHVYMYRNCKWPPTWRHPCLSCLTYMCVCMCACVHACACVCACIQHPDMPIPTPTPIHPSITPQGGTPRISKNSITLELIKIFQFHFEDLKI